jgi:hypothetical protein
MCYGSYIYVPHWMALGMRRVVRSTQHYQVVLVQKSKTSEADPALVIARPSIAFRGLHMKPRMEGGEGHLMRTSCHHCSQRLG